MSTELSGYIKAVMTAMNHEGGPVRKRATLAVAESLTAGNLQAAISCEPGASEYFLGGITTYNIDQKVEHLKVDRRHAKEMNCVSGVVAQEMARGVRDLFRSTIAISTTGYAQADPTHSPLGPYAWIGILLFGVEFQVWVVPEISMGADTGDQRIEAQEGVAYTALEILLIWLGKARRGDMPLHPNTRKQLEDRGLFGEPFAFMDDIDWEEMLFEGEL